MLWYRVSGHSSSSIGGIATDISNGSHKSDTIPSLSRLPSWLSIPSLLYLLGANSTHWWRSTRHYYMYTFIEKWIIIVYYEHNIIYASSRSDEAEVISDVYLYSRWLWWTLDVLHPFPHSPAGYESTWRAWRPADQGHCQFLISRHSISIYSATAIISRQTRSKSGRYCEPVSL